MDNYKYKLTIAILTMNRSEQLQRAVISCLNCVLPDKTQFVIVDNGSTDNTEEIVKSLFSNITYDHIYNKQSENRGAGIGKSICFDLSEGEYIYFLDDDGEIEKSCYNVFFNKGIDFLEKNKEVAILTTYVKDDVFGDRTGILAKTWVVDGVKCSYTFHGGTAFIRSAVIKPPLYFNIMYGNEETALAITLVDDGWRICYMDSLQMNHYPKFNKWSGDQEKDIYTECVCNLYILKRILYPLIFIPILYSAFLIRLNRKKIKIYTAHDYIKNNIDSIRKKNIKRIRISTILNLFYQYGLPIF